MALREVYARFGVEVEGASKLRNLDQGADRTAETLERTEKKAKDTGASLMGLASGVAAAFAGNALLGSIRGFAEELDTLDDLSTQTGIATDRLQELAYAAELNGSSQTEMFNSLNLLQKSLGKTASAAGPQAEALKKLGIATETASDLNSVLPEVFKGFGNLKNSQEEAAVATALFGRAGVRLLPTLRQGEKGMAALRAELDANGGIVADDTIRKAGEFKDNIARMDRALFALKGNLASAVFPQLSKVVTAIAGGVGALTNWTKQTTLAESGTVALAGTIALTLGKALGPYLKSGLKFGAIMLAFDDLFAFLQGKDSLIGRLLDAAFGDGTAATVRAWVLDAKNALGDFVNSASATADALTSSTSTWTEFVLAAVVGMLRDASMGFPAFQAGFASMLSGMAASLTEFVVGALTKWNEFVGAIKLPPALTAALAVLPGGAPVAAALNAAPEAQVDTTGLAQQAAAFRQAQNDRALEAQAAARGRTSPLFGTAAGGGIAAAMLAEEQAKGPAARTASTAQTTSPDARAGEQFANLTLARAQGFTATYNDQKKIELHFAAGTDSGTVDKVRGQVAAALKDDNRAALQILTQRGAK